ncbi:sialidase family protein [Sulfitobacter mediterraneus]|uniref:sialidase family protein n=1 Tax=Sulfitobacter mediterraneus TaxID=83219 RepID=UPI001268B837|nr:sialidase family protein [Sulfitobacter mediterraneus]
MSGTSLLMSWMVPTASEILVQFARLDDVGWSNPVTVGRGEDLFVNWADFPTVAAFGDGNIALHWLRRASRSGYGYHVELSLSNDIGRSWSDPIIPYSDRSDQQHGFVTMSGNADGALELLWLDARGYGQTGLLARADNMQLRATRIDADGRLESDRPVDSKTCSCCQTSSARLGDGSLVVAYRDRTDAEIRDISIVRLLDGAWTDPVNVHPDGWEISGCPVNGPAVAAQGERVAVAWFTAADDVAAVKLAFSDDAGTGFATPARIDLGDPLGRVDTLFLEDGSVLVTWLEWQGDDEVLLACRALESRGCVTRQVLARNSSDASMNFPRMARIGQDVYFALTTPINARQSTVTVMRGQLGPLE